MPRFLRETMLVARREFAALLVAPLYYVLCGMFFLLASYVYLTLLISFTQATFQQTGDVSENVTQGVVKQVFHVIHFFLMAQVPLLTMRVFSEDRASGALDLMQTTPLSDWALLLGKFLGCVGGLGLYLLATLAFPIATEMVSEPEWPVVWSAFAALILSAAAYTAIGLFFSALTESQVIAAVFTYVALLFLVLASSAADFATGSAVADAAKHFSVVEHANEFLKGSIAFFDVAYFVVLTGIFLFFTARVLESRRWRA